MEFDFNIRKIKMIKNILKLSTVTLMIIFSVTVYASKDDATKITVDEAQSKPPKQDTIKGGDDLKDKYIENNISISSIEKSYIIKRENLLLPPYRCFIYHPKGNETTIGVTNSTNVEFSIDKSKLKVGDIILVTNKVSIEGDTPIDKFIIEEINIIK